MTQANQYKVVITGDNIVNSEKLRIVKEGHFTPDDTGIEQALELGVLDKYGELGDRGVFITLAALPSPSKHEGVTCFAAIMKELAHNGRDVVAIFNVNVQFKPVQ